MPWIIRTSKPSRCLRSPTRSPRLRRVTNLIAESSTIAKPIFRQHLGAAPSALVLTSMAQQQDSTLVTVSAVALERTAPATVGTMTVGQDGSETVVHAFHQVNGRTEMMESVDHAIARPQEADQMVTHTFQATRVRLHLDEETTGPVMIDGTTGERAAEEMTAATIGTRGIAGRTAAADRQYATSRGIVNAIGTGTLTGDEECIDITRAKPPTYTASTCAHTNQVPLPAADGLSSTTCFTFLFISLCCIFSRDAAAPMIPPRDLCDYSVLYDQRRDAAFKGVEETTAGGLVSFIASNRKGTGSLLGVLRACIWPRKQIHR